MPWATQCPALWEEAEGILQVPTRGKEDTARFPFPLSPDACTDCHRLCVVMVIPDAGKHKGAMLQVAFQKTGPPLTSQT